MHGERSSASLKKGFPLVRRGQLEDEGVERIVGRKNDGDHEKEYNKKRCWGGVGNGDEELGETKAP